MERSELRRQISIGLGLVGLGVLVLWQVAGRPRNVARAEGTQVAPAALLAAGPKLDELERKVLGHIYSALLDGRSVHTAQDIVALVGEKPEAVRECLARLKVKGLLTFHVSGDLLTAPPFSAVPSRHVVWLADGRRVYACCAWHALAIPAIFESDATLRSETPQFERNVVVRFERGRIASVSPLGALLWIPRGGSASAQRCRNVNLFTSAPELALWQSENPGAARGFSPALTQAKRTATERLASRVRSALATAGKGLPAPGGTSTGNREGP